MQPLPIYHTVFHPDLGRPDLASKPRVATLVRTVEAIAEKVMPKWYLAHAYLRAMLR
ncbi:MAG: hypothetical protein U0165_02690 [Polyangiaceae bacterium]